MHEWIWTLGQQVCVCTIASYIGNDLFFSIKRYSGITALICFVFFNFMSVINLFFFPMQPLALLYQLLCLLFFYFLLEMCWNLFPTCALWACLSRGSTKPDIKDIRENSVGHITYTRRLMWRHLHLPLLHKQGIIYYHITQLVVVCSFCCELDEEIDVASRHNLSIDLPGLSQEGNYVSICKVIGSIG